ncbi:MAG: SWIM zinc finger family protein [Planctomycetes bacterium]|nr:SWIM zinc finger family protein [Planctomycetota bacterium]
MSLTTQLSPFFSSTARNRGRSYFAARSVRIVSGDDFHVDALVQGGSLYTVGLYRRQSSVIISCTCPYYTGGMGACKHVWATLLAAESKAYLAGSGSVIRSLQYLDPSEMMAKEEDGEAFSALEEEEDIEGEEWANKDSDEREEEEDNEPKTEEEDEEEEEGKEAASVPGRRSHRPWDPAEGPPVGAQPRPLWKKSLALVEQLGSANPWEEVAWPVDQEILYLVDVPVTRLSAHGLTVEVACRRRRKDGGWGTPKSKRLFIHQIHQVPDAEDRQILGFLKGAMAQDDLRYYNSFFETIPPRCVLAPTVQETLVQRMCQTGRCLLREPGEGKPLRTLRWNDGPPWDFVLVVDVAPSGQELIVSGALHRGDSTLSLTEPLVFAGGGLVIWGDQVGRFNDFGAFAWIAPLLEGAPFSIPPEEKEAFLGELVGMSVLPRLVLAGQLGIQEVQGTPRPRLILRPAPQSGRAQDVLLGELFFEYDGRVIAKMQPGRGLYLAPDRRYVRRDLCAERKAAERMGLLGFRRVSRSLTAQFQLAARQLPHVVRTLLAEDWHVEAEGKILRRPGPFRLAVNSGIDWFELRGGVQFGDYQVPLPQLLAALRRGEKMVRLGDGSFGMLPEEWLEKYGLLAGLGSAEDDHLRFTNAQVGFLDALLASQPEVSCDEMFERARRELRRFEGVPAAEAPPGFAGQLRGYQRDGVGWFGFLRQFGFGGCLADDMGLGKTVQVLALLEARRQLRGERSAGDPGPPGPSLAVVPRSLVFNWKQEAARFVPKLRVLDHTGPGRQKDALSIEAHDLVITTYGTLRRDAGFFKDVVFDYCILDEAQAIKNAETDSAKAARLLQARHRLALSGTPIENHLGELWSLFEFLNPGLLGSAPVFGLAAASDRVPDAGGRAPLARALRPFILRRTKAQVARDLPPKLEQTLYCEMEAEQRQLYDELRTHYRQALLTKVAQEGIRRVKIQVLEALLRLRQAALHPGLIDRARAGESSAKLDLLLPQLTEVFEEGHKALVFSQFTSMLAILRGRLDSAGIPYEYLDGRTRDRAERVGRFQTDPACKLFLVSLKAGGLGLNLTAAEYVFLLDPWWNPAVEAQAIDRTHRIGQTRQVFAYRLIARDTVEEKVLDLQNTKRDLADAILTAEHSLIRNLAREDLELLLS